MIIIDWKITTYVQILGEIIWLFCSTVRLTILSVFYNEFADWYYVGDTCMEPLFWLVDHFTKILGPVCVAGVLVLSSSVIAIAYVIGLPFYIRWNNNYILTVALILGHWLLLNVVFYYYMAYTTEPGYPPQGAMITEAVSICKKCIAPKPPRTHHCIVCNRCILKMDHHCPWLNNCIGHFNHRYFFMFSVYSWVGVLFIMIFGIPVAQEYFFEKVENREISSVFTDFIGNLFRHVFMKALFFQQSEAVYHNSSNIEDVKKKWPDTLYQSCILYAALLCIAVFFVLGGLLTWHARLISRGETSIESHINKKEATRFAKENKVYKNPYNFGPVTNWKLFLCIGDNRPWWYIFLPFAQKPLGNGLQWNYHIDDKNGIKNMKYLEHVL